MKITNIGSNMTEIRIGEHTMLFSYSTPVACHHYRDGYHKTEKKWSNTTSKHINKWLISEGVIPISVMTMPQEYFDNLVKGRG